MATIAVLAWYPVDQVEWRLVVEHQGRPGIGPGVAYFAGIADALHLAVRHRPDDASGSPTCFAVSVGEFPDDRPDATAIVRSTRRAAEAGRPGTIMAEDIVRMLLPEPDCGRWSEIRPVVGSGHRYELIRTDTPPAIGVVVAEDAAIIRAGIVALLNADGWDVLGEAADFEATLATVRRTRPHLLITDIRMPPGQGDEGLRAAAVLRSEQPSLSVLVLSQHVEAAAATLLLDVQTAGVGYLLKERVAALDEFLSTARKIAGGGTVIDPMITREMLTRRGRRNAELAELAERERDVLDLMAQGLSNTAIADRMTLSTRTVESHVRSIMTKLNIWDDPTGNRRVQAVIRWLGR